MKVQLNNEDLFKAFTITINIESKREAMMLQALTNNASALKDFINESNMDNVPKDYSAAEVKEFTDIWNLIYNQI